MEEMTKNWLRGEAEYHGLAGMVKAKTNLAEDKSWSLPPVSTKHSSVWRPGFSEERC